MNKKILGAASIAAIAAVAIFNVNFNSKNNALSLSLRDVEGLASEQVCLSSSSGNAGTCKKNVGSLGDSCVDAFGTPNCSRTINI
jgi:hypothetical protein